MGVRLRDDVLDSFRLVASTEWWVAVDLLAGIAGYVVWVAGSAALGMQVASLAEYQVAPGGTPTLPVLALAGLLWLVLPAALGVARVRTRLLNIRGNIDQVYRFDRPAALLVPPALLLVILAGVALAMGTIDPLLFLVLAPLSLYFLIRTIAYSYRVYAFSHPIVPYATLFATLAVQTGVLLLYLGLTTENGVVVRATVDALGLPIDPLATNTVGPLSAPAGLLLAVGVPIGLAVAYLLVQTAVALSLRVRDPTVRPTRVRTGQRYPPWLDVASSSPTPTSSDSSGSGRSGSSGSSSSSTASAGGSATDAGGGDGATGSGPDSSSGSSTGSGAATGATTQSSDPSQTASSPAAEAEAVDDEDAESVSHTRVFTPPGGDDDPLGDWSFEEQACSECGATVPADADSCPACGADSP